MQNPQMQAVKTEQLRSELEILASDIVLAKAQLGIKALEPSSPPKLPGRESPSKSRFSRLASTLRTAAIRKSSYKKIEEQALLETRRGSGDSDVTTVNKESASFLLSVLAPLVSALQKIGVCILPLRIELEVNLHKLFHAVCSDLLNLLAEVRSDDARNTVANADEDHDLEMRCLLLAALEKKVETERDRSFETLKIATRRDRSQSSSLTLSPAVTAKANPFILHTTSISSVQRTRAISKPIAPVRSEDLAYSAFAGISQSSWRMNVVRLGSYQASMLFSPSPIAVNKMMDDGART